MIDAYESFMLSHSSGNSGTAQARAGDAWLIGSGHHEESSRSICFGGRWGRAASEFIIEVFRSCRCYDRIGARLR